jgi:hypothetical protein
MTTPIKVILDDFFTHNNSWQIKLLNNWSEIVGSIQTKVQLLKIYNDTLIIGVTDSCWLQELYLLSPLLIHIINEKLEKPYVKELRFKTVGLPEKKFKKQTIKKECQLKDIHFTPREKEMLANIKDEQLRGILKEYLSRCYRERS